MTSSVPLRPFGKGLVWAPTGSEASAFDKMTIAEMGISERSLMECAGRSAAHVLQELFPRGDVAVVLGSGNNGGDGLVLARTLQAWGRKTKLFIPGKFPRMSGLDHGWHLQIDETEFSFGNVSVIVDAILGTGVKGKPRQKQAEAIRAINHSGCPVFSLDIPSGLDGDTGRPLGAVVSADVTVAFGWPKLGSLLKEGRTKSGRLIATEIGFPPASQANFSAAIATPHWAMRTRPTRRDDSHKNTVGSLLLVAGQAGMAGAAVLSAKAALRGGLGQIRIVSDSSNRGIIQSTVPEAIFLASDYPEQITNAVDKSDAIAIGPGLGCSAENGRLLNLICGCPGDIPLVLDADGLNMATKGMGPTIEEWTSKREVLLTPHLGEMVRISGVTAHDIDSDRLGVTKSFAEATGATVLLKGLPSMVVPPKGTALLDSMGSSDLAAAGMGDLLTGFAGALLAQGLKPACAGALSLYMVGRAAVNTGLGPSLIPTDILPKLAEVWQEEGSGETDLDLPFVVFDQDVPR